MKNKNTNIWFAAEISIFCSELYKRYHGMFFSSFSLLVTFILISSNTTAQSLTINNNAYLVTNGSVHLVVKDAAFINNGTFKEGVSTVKLSGGADTTQSYFSGNATTFYNLSTLKSANGVALKAHAKVRNVLNVGEGKLYTDSNLTLLSDSNLTARLDIVPSGVNIIGKANIERYIPGKRSWRLMTAPVTNSNTIYKSWQNNGVYTQGRGTYVTGTNPTGASGNGLDASPQNNVSMKGFNFTTQQFTNVLNTHAAISTGSSGSADNTGYFIFVRGDRIWDNFNYDGNVCNTTTLTSIGAFQTGTQTFQASKDSARFTLIGNPYASPIDFNNVVRNNIIKRIFVFDPTINQLGAWVVLDDIDNDGNYIKSIGSSIATKDIQSSQAFLVQTSGYVGSASLTFNESCKSGNNNNRLFRPSGVNKIESIRSNLYTLDSTGKKTLTDGVLSEFSENYSSGYNLEDAGKIINTDENIGISRGTLTFTIERRASLNVSDTIFLKVWKTTKRKYQLEFENQNINRPGMKADLEDNYLKTKTPIDLTGTSTYNFAVDANAASADQLRFRIVFALEAPLPVTLSNINAYQQNSSVVVEWKVENEINIAKYEVEKSTDGISFTSVGTKTVNGTANLTNSYSWVDVNVNSDVNYYRIKIYDADGQVKYSAIAKVLTGNTTASINVYPNPVKGNTINVQMNNQPEGKYQFRLFNHLGQIVYTNKLHVAEGNSVQSIKVNSILASGIYQLEIMSQDKKQYSQRVVAE